MCSNRRVLILMGGGYSKDDKSLIGQSLRPAGSLTIITQTLELKLTLNFYQFIVAGSDRAPHFIQKYPQIQYSVLRES